MRLACYLKIMFFYTVTVNRHYPNTRAGFKKLNIVEKYFTNCRLIGKDGLMFVYYRQF
jgi:hypothetical protein